MKLKCLLEKVKTFSIVNYRKIEITKVTDCTKEIKLGSLFVAIKGNNTDGHKFLNKAVENGATAVVISKGREKLLEDLREDIIGIVVPDTRKFLSKALAKFYGSPYRKIDIFGVTGTNGKTTVCSLLSNFFSEGDKKVGNFNTINFDTGSVKGKSNLTTPPAAVLQEGLSEMVSNKYDIAIIEASSHGISQYRICPEEVDIAILTNISHDHLDYHESMENYIAAKKKLFENLKSSSYAVLNKDDKVYKNFVSSTKANVISYGIKSDSDIMAKNIKMDLNGTTFDLIYSEGRKKIESSLIGKHNVYNILSAVAGYYVKEKNVDNLNEIIESFMPVKGRLQEIKNRLGIKVMVDYAHTPDSLLQILRTLNNCCKENVIIVFGCGGDRDKEKRPIMGEIASLNSDFFILTNDNPRGENPRNIICDIEKGIKSQNSDYEVILDREKAILKAISIAKKGDVVVITGKGHEQYQDFGNKKISFDDVEISESILRKMYDSNVES